MYILTFAENNCSCSIAVQMIDIPINKNPKPFLLLVQSH